MTGWNMDLHTRAISFLIVEKSFLFPTKAKRPVKIELWWTSYFTLENREARTTKFFKNSIQGNKRESEIRWISDHKN